MNFKTTRRGLLLTGTAAGATIAMPWIAKGAPEFQLKYANNSPLDHPLNVRANEAVARIKKETNGRVEIQVFPNNQLGSDTDMLSQLRSGAIEFFTLSGLILATLVKVASINGLGFIWDSYDKVWPAMDGGLGAHIRGDIAKAGLHAMEKQWDNGYRQMTSSTRPIKTPDDLKGFKIRVPPSPLWTSMFKAFDAAPMSINFAEVYSSLQTKVAEGQENPLSIIFFAKLYEVQKYLSETNHMWDGFWFLANGKVWSGLPADVRDVIAKNLNQSAVDQRADIVKLNASLKADLTGKGMQFLKVDQKPFRDKLQAAGFYKDWKKQYGDEAWAVLEKYTGPIA
ncbi:MAG TPA: TRAP transporter substrate-binding protein [Pseudolabrys sp.]|nr:TRAP transporter substrate-binding protein [Pseudolabrys sp.]